MFFASNDRCGTMTIDGSSLRRNPSDGFETSGFPGIFFPGAQGPTVSGSTREQRPVGAGAWPPGRRG